MNRPQNTKNKIKLIFWAGLSVFIGISFVSLLLFLFKNQNIFKGTENQAKVIQLIAPDPKADAGSQYFYTNKDTEGQLKVSATAYLVGDLNTGEVILSKNQDQVFPIASTSKLMTALIASTLSTSGDTTQINKTALATKGTNGELRLGEKIKISDLLYPLLLESSNDAAEAIAQYFGRDAFIAKMNQEAQNLQMSATSYQDPSGLSANNQSTVSDLFKLAGYLNQTKPDLFSITTKRSYSNKKHSWSNISQFLNEDGYLGGKSGYTDPAKQTDVALFTLPLGIPGGARSNRPIAITLLQSNDRHKDVENILKYLKQNIYYGGLADANTNWVKEKISAPYIKDPDFVTLAFGGDIMLDRGVRNSVVKNFNNDYSALFEKLDILKKSDIAFANLEGVATNKGVDQKNLYSFRMDPAVVPALAGAGVDVLSVANNHVGDWGVNAYTDMLAQLKENEISYTGGGNNQIEAEKPVIIEKYGMKIGYLAFSDKGPENMVAYTDQPGILSAKNPRFDEIIKNAATQVDYLIVSMHFGEEYQTKHDARQETLAHEAIDDGAKIIIGTHPHVIQDTEVYSRKGCTQSSCMGFIAYSLGNFIYDQAFSANTMQGMLLQLKLGRDGSLSVIKNIVKLNKAFKPDQIIKGKEEKVKFQTGKTVTN